LVFLIQIPIRSQVISVCLILFFSFEGLYAEENQNGRYQAVSINKNQSSSSSEVLVIDTKDGHLWKFDEWPAWKEYNIKGGRNIIYLGKLKPGTKFGEIIEKQDF
jgi:hypothetical protein